jgi:hypothetical protein
MFLPITLSEEELEALGHVLKDKPEALVKRVKSRAPTDRVFDGETESDHIDPTFLDRL